MDEITVIRPIGAQFNAERWIPETSGDISLHFVVVLAVVLGVVTWKTYRRESSRVKGAARWFLPTLRLAVVLLVVGLLLKPVLTLRSETSRGGRVLLLLDDSKSMARKDKVADPERARHLSVTLGLLSQGRAAAESEFELGDIRDIAVRRALAELHDLSRWTRLERLLLHPKKGLLETIHGPDEVEIETIGGELLSALDVGTEHRADLANLAEKLRRVPDRLWTDLARPLAELVQTTVERDLRSVVLFSDGRHNRPESPRSWARKLGVKGIPVHVVGIGSSTEPVDLAIVEVRVPATAFFEDRLEGTLLLKIRTAGSDRIRASILQPAADSTATADPLWSGEVMAADSKATELLEVPFVIPAKTLPKGRSELHAKLEPVSGEVNLKNNDKVFLVITKRRDLRVLLIDSRPRWETRYLKNLFQTDDKVGLDTVILGVDPEVVDLPRGDGEGLFPTDPRDFQRFDLIVLGDVPSSLFHQEELEWIRDFVDQSGGGLVLIAGAAERFEAFSTTPLGSLMPVVFDEEVQVPSDRGMPIRLQLTPLGSELAALRLVDDKEENERMWKFLPPITWVLPARALPGSETWVETQEGAVPVFVWRSFGRGRVLYLGTDQTWRWRYKVGGVYRQRLWGQLADHFRVDVFAVEGRHVDLDTDSASYGVGEPIVVRARLRDEEGHPRDGAKIVIQVLGESGTHREVPMEGVRETHGLYRAVVDGLEAGRYNLRAQVEGLKGAETAPTLAVLVEDESFREELLTSWDEELLRNIANLSGGTYFREEEVNKLPDFLNQTTEVEAETWRLDLSQSWAWFLLITGLLALEWVLRKRVGLL